MFESRGKRLPLRAVEVFEAAARAGGVNAAAQQLGITPPAVARHLRNLEERLGAPLFERGRRPAHPTAAARLLLPSITDALDQIAAACRNLHERDGGKLTISCPLAASGWLSPWALQFQLDHPDIQVAARSEDALSDFRRDGADAALRYGGGEYPGVHAEKLLDELVTPLCAPDFLRRHPIRAVSDLPGLNLMDGGHQADGVRFAREEWSGWLRAMGAPPGRERIGFTAIGSDQLTRLAADGKGVILGRGLTALEELKTGRLVAPLGFSTWTGHGYYFVCPMSARARPAVVRFAERLRADLAAHGAEMKKHFPAPRDFPAPPPKEGLF